MISEYLKIGDKIEVLCTKIDHVQGSIKLSMKQLVQKQQYITDSQQENEASQTGAMQSFEVDNLLAGNDTYSETEFVNAGSESNNDDDDEVASH